MPPSEFNFGESSSEPAGWRLERLEMANWGTFGGKIVHVLAPECGWTLLVGENGSGKSTAIDALRTLLAPRATLRHSFNDAAGGQRRQDRSLSSYIRGAWSASSEEGSGDAETRYLRKEEEPSFLLAVFRNRRQQATLTLAQILRVSNGKDEPTFLVAPGEKSITADLTNLDASRSLKKDLTARGFDVRDTYKAYREDFCSRMGIPGEGALEIFNQAIGVKEVSDVGIFLRRHLLSASSIADFVRDSVVPQFGNLESCWNDIAKAKAQIEMLSPIVEAHAKIQDINAKKKAFDDLSAQWITIFEWKEMGLLRDYLDICAENLAAAKAKVASLDETLTAISAERDALLLQQAGLHVTAQIESIKIRIKEADFRCKERRTKQTQLASILRAESLGPVPGDEAEFADMRERVASKREEN